MNSLIVGTLAVSVTASVALPLGWWLGGRHRSARERVLQARLAGLQHVIEGQESATDFVARRALEAMGDVVRTSARLLHEKRSKP